MKTKQMLTVTVVLAVVAFAGFAFARSDAPALADHHDGGHGSVAEHHDGGHGSVAEHHDGGH